MFRYATGTQPALFIEQGMARTIQAPNLENRNARLALPISTRPVYARLKRGRHAGNISRLRFHMDAKFLVRPLARITSRDWLRWRDGLAAKPSLSKSSVNRILNNLKAALNAAAEHDANINPRPWRVGLKSFGGADRTRNVILDEATIRALIECAYADSEPFGLLAEVAAVTGARFSQLRRLECQN